MIINFGGNSPEMIQASRHARASFKYFWRELSWEYRRLIPGLDVSLVKAPFATESNEPGIPSHEHMWLSDIQFDGHQIYGVLMNDPKWINHLHCKDSVAVPLDQISDWLYAIRQQVYGGFTVQQMRLGMGANERQQHDSAWSLNFPEPPHVLVTPHSQQSKHSVIRRLFTSTNAQSQWNELDYPEHPMSINMEAKIRETLEQYPACLQQLDQDGWTLLQREALAGNLTPVKLMMQYGADPDQKNPLGLSAKELAQQMAWSEVYQALQGKS